MKRSQLFLTLSSCMLIALALTSQSAAKETMDAIQLSQLATSEPTAIATSSAAIVPIPGQWQSEPINFTTKSGQQQSVLVRFKVAKDGKSIDGVWGISFMPSISGVRAVLGFNTKFVDGEFSKEIVIDQTLPPIKGELKGKFISPTRLEGTLTIDIASAAVAWTAKALEVQATPAPTSAATLKATTEATSAATSGSVAMGQLVKGKEWAITVQAVENIGKSVESPGMNLNRRVVITAPEGKHLLQVTISLTQLNSKEIGSGFIQKQIVVRDRAGISYPYFAAGFLGQYFPLSTLASEGFMVPVRSSEKINYLFIVPNSVEIVDFVWSDLPPVRLEKINSD
jgi:hypothetical protein